MTGSLIGYSSQRLDSPSITTGYCVCQPLPDAFQVPRFDWIEFHGRFEEHQAEAGRRIVSRAEAEEAWYGRRQFVRNRRHATGPYLLIGRTAAGRRITVVLVRTDEPETWLAYTAWDTPG